MKHDLPLNVANNVLYPLCLMTGETEGILATHSSLLAMSHLYPYWKNKGSYKLKSTSGQFQTINTAFKSKQITLTNHLPHKSTVQWAKLIFFLTVYQALNRNLMECSPCLTGLLSRSTDNVIRCNTSNVNFYINVIFGKTNYCTLKKTGIKTVHMYAGIRNCLEFCCWILFL